VAPDVARAGFGERIIVAPGTYQVNSVRHTYADLPCPTPRDGSAPRFVTETQYWPRAVMRSERGGAAFTSDAAVTMTRELFGLPDDALVFCDFNVLYKVDPGIFGVWMRLLRRHRGSVLWMGDNPVEAMERLRREVRAGAVRGLTLTSHCVTRPGRGARRRPGAIGLQRAGGDERVPHAPAAVRRAPRHRDVQCPRHGNRLAVVGRACCHAHGYARKCVRT
jgi:hypothetical protein